jgi:hypothetical protein
MSARTLQMLRYIADCGEVPLHVLLAAFWPDEEPERARVCVDRWVSAQRTAGNVARSVSRGTAGIDSTVRLTPRAARQFEVQSTGIAGHRKAREHFAQTLRFIESLRATLPANEHIDEIVLEPVLRAREQKGRATRAGQSYDSFPDAVIVVRRMNADGSWESERVAVEYVTSKYTTNDIRDKATSFAGAYARTLWVADSMSTARRVTTLVGQECPWLS